MTAKNVDLRAAVTAWLRRHAGAGKADPLWHGRIERFAPTQIGPLAGARLLSLVRDTASQEQGQRGWREQATRTAIAVDLALHLRPLLPSWPSEVDAALEVLGRYAG